MPIEYEIKYLFEITTDAISQYSEDHMSAYWFIDIEHTILRNIMLNDKYTLSYFKDYQLSAMRELIKRGLWVRWCEQENRPILSTNSVMVWNDSEPIPNGAD